MEIFIYILVGYIISEILCVLAVIRSYKVGTMVATFYSEGLAILLLVICLLPVFNTFIAIVYWSTAFWNLLWSSPSEN